ncbi:M20 metallopeptidase family protein [Hirschia baltica]|uniref:Amidohydrolase n=1 Tax=Hirschia baltica (strain ATCC 49814 / DSM 5838 / IFAM 1418) TaxID=582402 RepID=C6XP63_HIRBI|nr:amidohydrolase [Hirschia baltica]ACT60243.1 amidohydrolase [Hirschia baltica ATCC 49814]
MRPYCLSSLVFALLLSILPATAEEDSFDPGQNLHELYKWLHQNPELSFQEFNTSSLLKSELSILGFDIRDNIGDNWVKQELDTILRSSTKSMAGYGIIGTFENGEGPVILIRTDMDALPVKEQTGLAYASVQTTPTNSNENTPIMHACGHDIHMASWVGTARELMARKDEWSGTLIMLAQPAEEYGLGALSMIEDDAFELENLPNYNLAFHVSDSLPVGTIGYVDGPAMASINSVDITVNGIGGHGAYPHKTKDPIVIAAHIVTALQTLVSRTIDPRKSGVVTVGSLTSGTKHNIISDSAKLLLTVRTYDEETRKQLLDGIVRIAEGQAKSFGAPAPEINIAPIFSPAVVNNSALTQQALKTLKTTFGSESITEVQPVMSGEDFSRYRLLGEGIPSLLLWLGAVPEEAYSSSIVEEKSLPSLHSPHFITDPNAIDVGVEAMSNIAINLFNTPLSPTSSKTQ